MQGNSKIKQNQEVQKNVKMFKKCRLEKNRNFCKEVLLFGTAGIKALSSNDAKKFYTNVTGKEYFVQKSALCRR